MRSNTKAFLWVVCSVAFITALLATAECQKGKAESWQPSSNSFSVQAMFIPEYKSYADTYLEKAVVYKSGRLDGDFATGFGLALLADSVSRLKINCDCK